MRNKDRQFRGFSALLVIALFSCGDVGLGLAQSQSPPARRIDEPIPNPIGAAPLFTRADVIERLPLLPGAQEAPPAATASIEPRSASEPNRAAQGSEADAHGVASAPEKPAVTPAPQDVVEIRIYGTPDGSHVSFDPVGIVVRPGQTVRWVNLDPVYSHTVTAYHRANADHANRIPDNAAPWNSSYLRPNETFSIRLVEEGVYDYFCIPHERAGMVGRIVVGRPGERGRPQDESASAAGARAVPEAAQRVFPPVEEIMRLGVVRSETAGPVASAAGPQEGASQAASRQAVPSLPPVPAEAREPAGPEVAREAASTRTLRRPRADRSQGPGRAARTERLAGRLDTARPGPTAMRRTREAEGGKTRSVVVRRNDPNARRAPAGPQGVARGGQPTSPPHLPVELRL